MGMSTHVVGIVPPDADYKRMAAVYKACVAADVPVPDEVEAFFEGEPPDPAGMVIDLDQAAKEWEDDGRSGYEVDLDKVPKHVKSIRFYNSW